MADQSQSVVPKTGPRRLQHDDYTVAIICPMGVELAPIRALLDEEHESLSTSRDQSAYKLGMMGLHNVIVAVMPEIGNNAAAMVITQLLNDFKCVRFGLLVGIGGGVPDEDYDDDELEDIRLGDVVVSESKGPYGGVVQFDRGKSMSSGFVRTGHPNKPPHLLASSVEILKTEHDLHGISISRYLEEMYIRYPQMQAKYGHPGSDRDRLYQATYPHQGGTTCKKCDLAQTIVREDRKDPGPLIHYGTIGSSNMVIKDAQKRDELRDIMEILCVDMEAAGLMDVFPCLVVRGICDYADSHKTKKWQPYAASTAAAYTKELLSHIPPEAVMKTQAVTLEHLSIKINELTQSTQQASSRFQSAEEQEILEWLSPKDIDFSSPYNQSRQVHTPGTGQWLLDDERYRDWRDVSPGLLWLRGAAGCGKTIICSTAIHDLQTLTKESRTSSLAYWYFRFDNTGSQNVSIMLRSIIRQLSPSPLSAGVRALRDRHKQAGSNPSLDELIATLHHTLHDAIGDVYVVLDALDECPSTGQLGQREKLLQYIENLFCQPRFNLHLLITSRPEPDIWTKMGPVSRYSVDIEELLKADVERYVDAVLMDSNLGSWAHAKEKIRDKLLSFGERRFRWAELQMRRFTQCPTDKDLEDALNSIPRSLEESYQKAFESIPNRSRVYVRKIMMWLAVSLIPLTTEEVAAVVGFRTTDFLIHICTTLLVTIIDKFDSDIIKLAHFSVKEFLVAQLQEEESWQWYRFSTNMAHEHVAYTTLQALVEPRGELRPIIFYAADFWHRHAREGLKSRSATLLQNQINRFFDPNHTNQFLGWLEILKRLRSRVYSEDNLQPLYYASLLGFEATVRELWFDESQLSRSRRHHQNALEAAAIKGNVSILKWILNKCEFPERYLSFRKVAGRVEANEIEVIDELCNKMPHSGLDQSVFEAAASNTKNGQLVMKQLLEKKGDQIHISEGMMKAAAGNWRYGHKMVGLLLEKNRSQVQITRDVVMAAVYNGDQGQEVMELLLEERGEDVHIAEAVIEIIVGNFNVRAVELLFEKKGDQICITESMVKAAVGNVGHGGVFGMLIERHSPNKQTAQQVMQLLLDKDEHVQITEGNLEAAVQNAIGGYNVMKLLLQKKGHQMQITESVICAAARYGNYEVMELLLEQHIEITQGLVEAAAGKWQNGDKLMKLLLTRTGCSSLITENAIRAAARNECCGKDLIELFFEELGHQIQITEGILKAASRNQGCGAQVMRFLFEKGGDQVQIPRKVVLAAAEARDSTMMQLLLEKGADPTVADHNGFTPLNTAAYYGRIETVRLLLEKGVDPTSTEDGSLTVLEWALKGEHIEVVKLLLKEEANQLTRRMTAAHHPIWLHATDTSK